MPPRKPKESSVEEFFVKSVDEAFSIEARKYKSRMHDPDRVCFFPNGLTVFVELKRPGEEPRPGQIREHNRLRALGYLVYVIDSKPGVLQFIEEMGCRIKYMSREV